MISWMSDPRIIIKLDLKLHCGHTGQEPQINPAEPCFEQLQKRGQAWDFVLALGINMATHDKALLALVTPTHVGRSHLTLRICTLVPSKKNYRYSQ